MSPAYNPTSSNVAAAAATATSRASARGGLSSPWNHVVRGDPDAAALSTSSSPSPPEIVDRSPPPCPSPDCTPSSPSIAPLSPSPPPEDAENGSGGNAAGKRPAWNVPASGASDGGAVMGADSWPALSESAKGFSKSVSSEPSRVLPNGSIPVSVEAMIGNPRPKISSNSSNPSSSSSSAFPARQKPNLKFNPNKRNTGGSSSSLPSNGAPGSPQQSSTSLDTPLVALEAVSDPSPKDHTKGNTHWDNNRVAPQHHGGGDNRVGYNRNRRGNNGGGGFHRERGGQDWNAPRGFFNRGARMSMPLGQHRAYTRPFAQPPPPPPAPFIGMPPPFGGPVGFPEVHHVYYASSPPPLDPLRSMHYVPHQVPPPALAPAVFVSPVDPHRPILLKQIEYYFSPENLRTDTYLKEKMDDQGWVPISLIAGFNRVKKLTNDTSYILDIMRGSAVVEIQGDKIRPRNDWMKWVRHPMPKSGVASSLRSPATAARASLTNMQSLMVDENVSRRNNFGGQSHAEMVLSKSACGNLNDQIPHGELVETKICKFQSPQNQIDPNLQKN